MKFLRYPVSSLIEPLSHADHTVLRQLLLYHYRFCRGDYEAFFYLTDRDLSKVTGCSTSTIWQAKKKLRTCGLIDFFIGDKNRTYYKLIAPNGDDPLK